MTNKTISGYYYNPETKSFILGTFPYPSVIFNRIPLREKRYQHLIEHIQGNLFNYPYGNTNKWDFWVHMSKQPIIKKHLPRTKEYQNVNSVLKAFQTCEAVYLKPATMAGGNGIFHVKKASEGYLWSDGFGNKFPIKSKEEFIQTLQKNLIKNKKYLIQEEIPSFNKEKNKIDFRVYLQKDYTKKWKYSGMETKVGQKDSIISNSKNRERVIPGETALKEIYNLNEDQTKQKVEEITQLCIRALKVMEKKGYKLGDAAVDLVIDKNKKVWLLEVQLNYAAEIKANRTEDEQRILPLILPTPFEYAKSLSGF
ncbi:YheC/YheD family protein [Bacillus sp. ISL-57]|nr:YheC/YheD family protein [Bacillus sp. ISL-57]MBT2719203.1 YheC/YheD family protein [Bacillus sp. ISL-57]